MSSNLPQQPQQRYELLKELPPEILDRILVQFCDGKALSTLALTCATSHRYESLYQTIWISVRCSIFTQIAGDIRRDAEASIHDAFHEASYTALLRWVGFLEMQSGRSELAPRATMKILSEDMATIDFLRRRGMRRVDLWEPKWDSWPVWIGPVAFPGGLSANVQIVTSGFPESRAAGNVPFIFHHSFPSEAMPGLGGQFQIVHLNDSRFGLPRNVGVVLGLTAKDDDVLTKIAKLLDDSGPSCASEPIADLTGPTLKLLFGPHVSIVTRHQARLRYEQLQPSSRHRAEKIRDRIFTDSAMEKHPLICFFLSRQ
jgi:hypothetical protein